MKYSYIEESRESGRSYATSDSTPSPPTGHFIVCDQQVMAMFDGDTLSTSGGTVTASDGGSPPSVGVVLAATSFYAEAGGQAADTGRLSIGEGGAGGVLEVADVRMFGGFALHVGRLVSGRFDSA